MLVAVMWIVFIVDQFAPLEAFGLIPRTFKGLVGILAMPVLHANLNHIISNTVPLIVLGVLLVGASARSAAVIASVWLIAGAALWIGGRHASHIGASGVVFGLVSYLIVSGILERRFVPLMIAVLVGFLYGGMLFPGVLPFQAGVSWDGHLFGAIAGVITAFLMRTKRPTNSWG